MRVNWLPRWIKWGGAVAVVGVLVGLAISRPGFPEAAAELNDQSVWVTNSAQMKVGRYNQPIEELTGGLRATSAGFDVLQQAQQVALGEVGTVRLIDPATVTAGEGSRADDQAVFTLGGGVVLTVDGAGSRAWLRRFDQAATLRTNQDKASFELGSGGVATVATDGTVYAAKDDGTLLKAVLAG
ncbi:MAG: hypothetical protein FWD29_07920, partial [Micrococcales bacterium]|nr:hypothetical protein [Micrococcales bacterium]